MGKQRTEFFKRCIIIFIMIMFLCTGAFAAIVLEYGYDLSIIIMYLLGAVIANIVCIIVLYFLWSVLKTLEEIRDRTYSISIEKNKKEEE